MTTCPNCGAKNDPGNRFCDQCGTRLDAAAAGAPAAAPVAPDQPTLAAPVCPTCGTTVLPGEAFCDNCGADLKALTASPAQSAPASSTAPAAPGSTAVSSDAPTIMAAPAAAAPAPSGDAPTPAAGSQVTCPICGSPALPGERFCDNCGADLTVPAPSFSQPGDVTMVASGAAPAQSAPAAEPSTGSGDETILSPIEVAAPQSAPAIPVPPPAPADAPPIENAAPGTPAADPSVSPGAPDETGSSSAAAAPDATAAPVLSVPPVEPAATAPPAPPPASTEPAAGAGATSAPAADAGAERTRLEGLVAAHRDTVAQYEQMASRYPAGSAPAFITAGLDAARAELARAEQELTALPVAVAGPDPAEVARLEGLVAAHRDTVAQYEQMASRYPAGSAPAFITAGLDAARAELANAEAELAALIGGATMAAPAQSVPAASAPSDAAASPAPAPAATPPAAEPAAATAAPGPRLVLGDGKVISLPADRAEIIIGREDPVSNIFPEVDLTPHGGEAGGVSRQHAKITSSGGQWMLTDLNSTNYTRIDGARLDPNVAAPLHDGAKVQFGRVAATFHL